MIQPRCFLAESKMRGKNDKKTLFLILGQPVQIISCSASMLHYALYKEDKHYSHDDYDENEPDSPTDDLIDRFTKKYT